MRASLVQTEISILEDRIQVMETTIQMLSYNLRCLNIRQGSQPIELPEVFNPKNITFDLHGIHALDCMDNIVGSEDDRILKCTPDEFEHMCRNLVFNEHCEVVKFGADETAWAK